MQANYANWQEHGRSPNVMDARADERGNSGEVQTVRSRPIPDLRESALISHHCVT